MHCIPCSNQRSARSITCIYILSIAQRRWWFRVLCWPPMCATPEQRARWDEQTETELGPGWQELHCITRTREASGWDKYTCHLCLRRQWDKDTREVQWKGRTFWGLGEAYSHVHSKDHAAKMMWRQTPSPESQSPQTPALQPPPAQAPPAQAQRLNEPEAPPTAQRAPTLTSPSLDMWQPPPPDHPLPKAPPTARAHGYDQFLDTPPPPLPIAQFLASLTHGQFLDFIGLEPPPPVTCDQFLARMKAEGYRWVPGHMVKSGGAQLVTKSELSQILPCVCPNCVNPVWDDLVEATPEDLHQIWQFHTRRLQRPQRHQWH